MGGVTKTRQDAPGRPKMAQRRCKMVPRWPKTAQDEVKMESKWPKMRKVTLKIRLKTAKKRILKDVLSVFTTFRPRPGPKMAPPEPKMAPRWNEDGPGGPVTSLKINLAYMGTGSALDMESETTCRVLVTQSLQMATAHQHRHQHH